MEEVDDRFGEIRKVWRGLVGHIPPVGETERRGMEGERRERGAETISGR